MTNAVSAFTAIHCLIGAIKLAVMFNHRFIHIWTKAMNLSQFALFSCARLQTLLVISLNLKGYREWQNILQINSS